MQTTKSYTTYQLTRLPRGSTKWQLRGMGWVPCTLEDARRRKVEDERSERFIQNTPKDVVRILRLPDGPHVTERLQWLVHPLGHAKALSKTSYLVMAPMHGEEEGADWLVGCFPTIKAAKEHAGHYGWLISVRHMDDKREWRYDQPAPPTPDLWRVES
jgi:hypothetical protein